MALNVFELFGKIAIDSSGAEKGIKNTVNHAKDAEGKLTKTFKKIGTAVAAAFSVKAIVDFGKQCTEAYASIAAEESAFAQIMGDYADTANAKLKAVSDATGVSTTRMTSAMTSLTAKFKGLGYNVEDATTLATDGLLIATDAAAFWDMSLDESMSHLNSFINGSYEGGEAIGLFANDTQMAAYAVEQGIVKDAKAWAKLSEAQKQATRLDYAKKMMTESGATGQAAKEADAYANVMANLKESWRQFQGVVGKPVLEKFVLPAMQKLNDFLPKLTESVTNGIAWLEEGFDKIASYFTEVFTEDGLNMDALPNALKNMFRDLGRGVGSMLTSFGRTLQNAWNNTVWPMTQRALKAAFGIDVPKWSEIEKIVKDWWDGGNGIAKEIANVCNWTLNLFGAPDTVTADDVSKVLSTWWTNTKGFVQNACQWALGIFQRPASVTLSQVKATLSNWWNRTKLFAQKACNWALDLFGAPEGTTEDKVKAVLSSWWTTVCGWVAGACNWALNLFGAPADVDEDDVSGVLSTWWTNTVGFVQSACKWVLGLFSPPGETDEEGNTADGIIAKWWAGVKGAVQGACTWVLGLFSPPGETDEEGNTADGIIAKWWEGVKASVQNACSWVLNMFNPPEDTDETSAVSVIKAWWAIVKPKIEDVCRFDLKNVNLACIFTAANTAKDNFLKACGTFVNDVIRAIFANENGRIVLNRNLSGLFDGCVNALTNILTIASTLVADVVGAITGKKEDAEKIGAVFSDLFGLAGETVIGVKDNVLGIFDWFLQHGEVVAGIIGAVATKMIMFTFAHPATAVLTALSALLTINAIDWENFEKNYPNLVDMFERFTGLDFTKVADSLGALKDGLAGVADYFRQHEAEFNGLLMVMGALVVKSHPAAGVALMTAGANGVLKKEVKDIANELSGLTDDVNLPFIKEQLEYQGKGADWAAYLEGWKKARRDEGYSDADIEAFINKQFAEYEPANAQGVTTDENPLERRMRELFDELLKPKPNGDNPKDLYTREDAVPYGEGGGNALQNLMVQLQAVLTELQGQPAKVSAAVTEGMSGMTITGTVHQGNVQMDGSTVGRLIGSHVNFILGQQLRLNGRGNA